MEERVEWFEARGRRAALAQTLGGAESNPFVVSRLYSSLGEYEQTRAENAADPTNAEWGSRVSALLGGPTRNEILRVLVPYPGR
jgi:hypothetical protein